jgi:hypothetical protein
MQQVLTDSALETQPVFVVMVGARACAFPLHHVDRIQIETRQWKNIVEKTGVKVE